MTAELEQLVFTLDANIARMSKKMDEANGKVDRAARKMERRMAEAQRQIEQSMERAFGNPFDGLKSMAASLAAGLSTAAITGMADAWTEMEGRAGQAIAEGENAGDVMARLSDMALRTYSSLEQTAEGFFRNANTLKALGYSTDEALNYIEALNNALVVSGAKGQRAESVMSALSKAMASGKLDGDNLNTIIESGGRVAELLAENLGVTTLELAKMGKAGKITGDVLYNSLVGNLELLRDEADSMAATVGDAIQNAATKLTQYVGEADKSLGATEKLAQAIEFLSDNYDVMIPLVSILGSAVGVNMVQNLVRGQIAAYGLAGSFRVAGAAAMGAFGGPVGLAITGVTVALGYLAVKQVQQSQNLKNLKEKVEDYRTEQEYAAKAAKGAADEQSKLTGKIPADIINLAKLTGQVKLLGEEWFQVAAAARLAQKEQAKAVLTSAESDLKTAKRELASAQRSDARIAQGGGMNAGTGFGGSYSQSASASARTKEAQALVEAAERLRTEAWVEYQKLATGEVKPLDSRSPRAGGTEDKISKSDAAAAKRRAEMTETLRLERELLLAQETGDKKRIQAAEDAIRLRQLLNQYTETNAADAAKSAGEHLAIEQRMRDSAEAREALEAKIAASVQAIGDNSEKYAREQRRIADLTQDELGYKLQIARLNGDEKGVKAAERELYITQRIAELRGFGVGTDDADRKGLATKEADEIDEATAYGKARETFSKAFAEGLRALSSGDFESFAENMAGSFTQKLIEDGAGQLYDMIFGGGKAAAEGATMGAAQGAAAATSITGAGTTVAGAFGTAITSAGKIAAADIAAAVRSAGGGEGGVSSALDMVKSLSAAFGGGRATGGRVNAGTLYQVNDGGGPKEFFAPAVNGTVMTAAQINQGVRSGLASVAQRSSGSDRIIKVLVDKSEYFDVAVESKAAGVAAPMAVQAAKGGSQMAQVATGKRQRRRMGTY